MKTPDQNDLKLGTVVVLDSLLNSQSLLVLGSKRQGLGLGLLPVDQNYARMCSRCHRI